MEQSWIPHTFDTRKPSKEARMEQLLYQIERLEERIKRMEDNGNT